MNSDFSVRLTTNVKIYDADTNEMLVDKSNSIHPQNMARIISRALAKESNSYIYRIAFGNGGTVTDPTGQVIFNTPNDGRNGSWESRLYNETYSEIVETGNISFGSDPGSAEPGNIRTGGGAVPEDDPAGGGVVSQEVGSKSNVIVTMFINKNEPQGQLATINDFGVEIDERESTFIFDELGLYSSGKQAAATSGVSSVYVGNKTSEDVCLLEANTNYTFSYIVDGNTYFTTIATPSAGSGPAGAFTYGDLCEGLNSGAWLSSGDNFPSIAYVFITDRAGSTYPTISNRESYGFLTFQSLITGSASTVQLVCNELELSDLFRTLTNNICADVNVNQKSGADEGVMNDTITPENERERLLTHLIFPPISKTADKSLKIVYTLTVTVERTSDSRYTITNV